MKTISKNMVPIMVALIAISVGATFAVTYSTALESLGYTQPSSAAGAFITGHVEAVVRDNEGVIKAYRQADNAIVTGGMEVLADQLFLPWNKVGGQAFDLNLNNHTNNTGFLTGGRFGYMNIGNGTTAVSATNTGLACPLQLGYGGCGTGGARPLCVAQGTKVWNTRAIERTVGVPLNVAQINVTHIATFAGSDCFSNAIREAALWNNRTSPSANGNMFARNTFGSVTLTATDSLELTWRFTFTDQ
ncbi:MAG: hypothetical protein ACREAK_01510 [Nitrosarchaeum sp.]